MSSVYFLLPGKIFSVFIGVYFFKYLSRPYKLVLLLIAIALFCESYGYYISKYNHAHNAWLFNIYIIVEVWLLGISATYLINSTKIKNIFLLLLATNSLIWIGIILQYSIYVFANVSMVVGCCFITVIYVIVLYTNSLFSDKAALKQPVFWLSVSTILYFACDIPYMGLHNYMIQYMPSVSKKLGNINTILDIIRYPLVAISFILLGLKKGALKAA